MGLADELTRSFGEGNVEAARILERRDGDVHFVIKRGFWEVRNWFEGYYTRREYVPKPEMSFRCSTVSFFKGENRSAFVNITPCPCNKNEVLVTVSELVY